MQFRERSHLHPRPYKWLRGGRILAMSVYEISSRKSGRRRVPPTKPCVPGAVVLRVISCRARARRVHHRPTCFLLHSRPVATRHAIQCHSSAICNLPFVSPDNAEVGKRGGMNGFVNDQFRGINMRIHKVDAENIESTAARTAFQRVRCKPCLAPRLPDLQTCSLQYPC